MKGFKKLLGLTASVVAAALTATSCGSTGGTAASANTANNAATAANTANNATTASNAATAANNTTAAAAASSAIDNSKFVTISMYNFGDPSNDSWKTVQQAMNDYLKNNTQLNCGIELHYMTWTNWQSNYATLLASGQPIDFVNTASDWLNMWQNAQKGAFYDLTDELPTYAPDVWAGIPQDVWNACKYNGRVICFPENAYTQWVNHGFGYRNDWAKQAGITDGIHSWDQMTQYMTWIKANKPDVTPWDAGSGNGVTIGGYMISNSTLIPMAAATDDSMVWSTKSDTDTTVVCPYTDPSYNSTLIQWATLMKQWNDAGFWKTDVMNNPDSDQDMIKAGQSGVFQHHVQTFRGMKLHFDTVDQPGADLEFFGWWEPNGNLTKMSVTHGATAIGANSQNPQRAMQLFNLIYTDQQFYMLLNYGILNQTYFLNDQGAVYTPNDFDINKSAYYADFWGGRLDKFEPPNANDFPGYQAYSDSLTKIAKPLPFDGCPFDLTNVQNYVDAVQQIVTTEEAPMGWGKVADPAAAVNQFAADLKAAGVDNVTAELQKQLDAWKAQQ